MSPTWIAASTGRAGWSTPPSSRSIVLIAQLVGITDVAALVGLVGVNASMILFGWLQERYEQPRSGGWLPFWFGCVAGIGPWLAAATYLIVNVAVKDGPGPPGFVYGIIVSLFVFFNSFAINQWLQYAGRPVAGLSDRGADLYRPQSRAKSRWRGRSSQALSPDDLRYFRAASRGNRALKRATDTPFLREPCTLSPRR